MALLLHIREYLLERSFQLLMLLDRQRTGMVLGPETAAHFYRSTEARFRLAARAARSQMRVDYGTRFRWKITVNVFR
jgi:hypothetical protein